MDGRTNRRVVLIFYFVKNVYKNAFFLLRSKTHDRDLYLGNYVYFILFLVFIFVTCFCYK
jgi:hypothetical protein